MSVSKQYGLLLNDGNRVAGFLLACPYQIQRIARFFDLRSIVAICASAISRVGI